MKKALVVGIILMFATLLPLPARAVIVKSWSGFTTAWNFWPAFGVPLQVSADIHAPAGAKNLGTWSAFGTSVWLDGTINGSGADAVFWVNKACPLFIAGGEVNNSGSTTHNTIVNNGKLTLNDVTLQNGVNQTDSSYPGTTLFGAGQPGGTIYLNGNSNFTVGDIAFAPGAERTNVYFNGGIITNEVAIGVDGFANYFHITGGSVTYAPVRDWNWGMGAGITLSDTGTLTLENLTHNTLNTSDQSGNSIYSQTGGTLNLTNGSNLALNDSGSKIIGGTVNIGSANGTGNILTSGSGSTIGSGATVNIYSGNTFNVSGGTATLNGSGPGSDSWAGTVNLSAGSLTLDSLTTHGSLNVTGGTLYNNSNSTVSLLNNSCSFTGGRFVNHGTLDLTTSSAQSFGTSLSGTGVINKNGAGTMRFTGENSGYTGDLYVHEGLARFIGAESYISGTTHLIGGDLHLLFGNHSGFKSSVIFSDNSTLTLDTGAYNVTTRSAGVISGVAGHNMTLVKKGSGTYTYQTNNAAFDFNLRLHNGMVRIISDAVNFNDNVSVGQGPGNPFPTLNIAADSVSFNNGLSLSNGNMYIAGGGFDVTAGGLSVGSSSINTMNGIVATNNITGGLNVGPSGTANFAVDISPSTGTSDKYKINGNITATHPAGIINVSNIGLSGPVTDARQIGLNIFQASGTIDPDVQFTATDAIALSPYAQYSLSSLGNGAYNLNWVGYNPQVFRGQIAAEAAFANQLTTNNVVFDHVGLVSRQLASESRPDASKRDYSLFTPYQYDNKGGGFWAKLYGNLETLELSQGISTSNDMWAALFGADFALIELKDEWKFLPTAYFGYTGGYQTYSGVDMTQNGGQLGLMGTIFKGGFMSSLLVNAGGYSNQMTVSGTESDNNPNWFAGIASKTAYNIGLPRDFILQPNLLLSYNAFGAQSWNSSFGGSFTSDTLNGFNVAPGLNAIYKRPTWSVYGTTRVMFNVASGASGSIQSIPLPKMKMGTMWVENGIGFTKQVQDRLSMYGETVLSNGVREGVGFQGGLQWKF